MAKALNAVVLAAAALTGSPATAQHVIRNDATGGDCTRNGLGAWRGDTRTCRLQADLRGTVELADDGLVLDGGGHVLSPRAGDRVGVLVNGRSGTAVHTIEVAGFEVGVLIRGGRDNEVRQVIARDGTFNAGGGPNCGIELRDTASNRVHDNTVEDNRAGGICLVSAHDNRVFDNPSVSRNDVNGVLLFESNGNTVQGNVVNGPPRLASDGIALFESARNTVRGNEVHRHGGYAFYLHEAPDNVLVFNQAANNDFANVVIHDAARNQVLCNDSTNNNGWAVTLLAGSVGNTTWMNNAYAQDDGDDWVGAGANAFQKPLPVGGNYWARNAAACVDANLDGFCDAPYALFRGNQDLFPRVRAVPWRANPAVCEVPAPPKPVDPTPPPPPPQQQQQPPPRQQDGMPGQRVTGFDEDALRLSWAVALAVAGAGEALAPRLADTAVLKDGSALPIHGKEAVLAALTGRAKCERGRARARPRDASRQGELLTLRLRIEGCAGARSDLVVSARGPERLSRIVQVERTPPVE